MYFLSSGVKGLRYLHNRKGRNDQNNRLLDIVHQRREQMDFSMGLIQCT